MWPKKPEFQNGFLASGKKHGPKPAVCPLFILRTTLKWGRAKRAATLKKRRPFLGKTIFSGKLQKLWTKIRPVRPVRDPMGGHLEDQFLVLPSNSILSRDPILSRKPPLKSRETAQFFDEGKEWKRNQPLDNS